MVFYFISLLKILRVVTFTNLIFLLGCLSACVNEPIKLKLKDIETKENAFGRNQQPDNSFHSLISRKKSTFSKWKVSKINTSKDIRFIEFIDSRNGWARSRNDDFFQTINSGENWELLSSPTNSKAIVTNLTFISSLIGWKTLEEQESRDVSKLTILQTKDGGKNWTIQFSDKDISLAKIVFINENEGWAVGTRRVMRDIVYGEFFVLHTIDGGENWINVSDRLSKTVDKRQSNISSIHSIYASESGEAIIITGENRLFKTTNGGESWEEYGEIDLDNRLPQFLALPNNIIGILAGVGGYHCCSSIIATRETDGSWTKNILTNFYLSDAVFYSEKAVFACGTMSPKADIDVNNPKRYGVILFSSDSGKNWELIYQNKKIEQINSITISDKEKIWAVGNRGLILSARIKNFF